MEDAEDQRHFGGSKFSVEVFDALREDHLLEPLLLLGGRLNP
jgi:hypothetical protein